MTMMQVARENPLKSIFGAAGSVIAIVTALFAVDARYAHAADVEKDKKETNQIIQETAIILRKSAVEDKLFELDVRQAQSPSQRLSPLDSALQQRYRRQLDDLNVRKKLD